MHLREVANRNTYLFDSAWPSTSEVDVARPLGLGKKSAEAYRATCRTYSAGGNYEIESRAILHV